MTAWKQKIGAFRRTTMLTAKNIVVHDVSKSAAALAYYFLFALFPLLIFGTNLLGLLDLNITEDLAALQTVIPKAVVQITDAYLRHVSRTSSHGLLWFSLVFTIWFPMRAISGLSNDVRRAYRLDRPAGVLRQTLKQLLVTVVFLLLIFVILLLSLFGQQVITGILRLFPNIWDPQRIRMMLRLWQYLRFVLAAGIMFLAISMLHLSVQEERKPLRVFFPGVAISMVGWLLVSIGFSFYVENLGSYSVVYGALGTVIVLLTWLYLTAVMLLVGAEFNSARIRIKARETR